MERETKKRHMDAVYVLLLFAVFAGCILLVLLFGASSYEKLVERDNRSFSQRTGVSYIAAKVRHNDYAGCVTVGSFSDKNDLNKDEIQTLYLQFIGEDGVPVPGYDTKIYYYDGYIREALCEEGIWLEPEAGNEIMEASNLTFSLDNNLLSMDVTFRDGSTSSITLLIRSAFEQTLEGSL